MSTSSFIISPIEGIELAAISSSPNLPKRMRRRARIILEAAAGTSTTEIARKLDVSRPTVLAAIKAFLSKVDDRVGGILTTRRAPTEAQKSALSAVMQNLPQGAICWTIRGASRETGVAKSTLHRLWQRRGVHPLRLAIDLEPLRLPDELEFRIEDVAGVYWESLRSAVAFVAGPRRSYLPQKQADQRKKARDLHSEFIASLRQLEGLCIGRCELDELVFTKFLALLEERHPRKDIHVLFDYSEGLSNLAGLDEWLRVHPSVHIHSVPLLLAKRPFLALLGHWLDKIAEAGGPDKLVSLPLFSASLAAVGAAAHGKSAPIILLRPQQP